MEKESIQITARLPVETHRKLRFLAADMNISLNEVINRFLLEAMAGHHVSVPTDLRVPE
jgi:predicted HicB family RNase H-like nuclease